jgi:hypothetical protein
MIKESLEQSIQGSSVKKKEHTSHTLFCFITP